VKSLLEIRFLGLQIVFTQPKTNTSHVHLSSSQTCTLAPHSYKTWQQLKILNLPLYISVYNSVSSRAFIA
jgi:hypothetical protein